MKKLILLVAILAMVLGYGSLALAQTTPSDDQSTNDQTTTDQPSDNQTTTDQSTNDQTTTDQPTTSDQSTSDQTTSDQPSNAQPTTDQSALPCGLNLFRQEQEELVQFGYPTTVSERARECESLGWVNPYPAPAMLGPDNFVYPYDPIEGQYMYFDPSTGLYYVLDPDTGEVSTYDPASGTYV